MAHVSTADLSGIEETAFITLHGRVLDAQADEPILADPYAIDAADQVDYDFSRLQPNPRLDLRERLNVAIRAVIIDSWVRSFIDRNPHALVIDLGCGLDSRAFRLAPPPSVDWYDVDFPAMIQFRATVYPQAPTIHPLGTSLNETGWLSELPKDRPAIAVADGLYPFMKKSAFPAMLNAISRHLFAGEFVMNGYTKLSSRMMPRVLPAVKTLGLVLNEGFDDPHDVERWNPDLTLVEQSRLIDSPDVEKMPARFRWQCKVMRNIPVLARQDVGVLRYRFGDTDPHVR
jgi:O-methyltransferase involved in polyketide biosynthesis